MYRKRHKKPKRFQSGRGSSSESDSSPNEYVDSDSGDESIDSEEEEHIHTNKRRKIGAKNDDEELLMYEDDPFEVIPPAQQPAGIKRKGTGYINANLPQPPFTVLIVGPRKTGKTVTLYNMLQNRTGAYGRAFIRSNIILYSPTSAFDKTLESLKLKWTYGPPMLVDTIVSHIKSEQSVFKTTNAMADILLVLEDITNIPNAWNTMKDLAFTGRHFGIHTIAVAHKMSSINRGVRTQTQQWMLFKPHEESEVEWVLYTFARKKTRDIFEAAFSRAWDTRYNFVYIDFERDGGIPNIYRSGFNDPLFTPEEVAALENIRLYRPDGQIAINADREEDEVLPEPSDSKGKKRTASQAFADSHTNEEVSDKKNDEKQSL